MPDPARPPARRPVPVPQPDILAQLTAFRPVPQAAPTLSEDPQDAAARGRALDDILTQIVAEPEAAFRPVAVLYQDFLVRCRIQAVGGTPPDLAEFRRLLAAARAGLHAGTTAHPDWEQAAAMAQGLPEDAQGVFLLLARAALDGAACPSDTAIARVYGTHSTGRARRLLSYLEAQNVIVCCPEPAGARSVAVPGLGWRTAPGNPHEVAA
jgi:hypothetical protein